MKTRLVTLNLVATALFTIVVLPAAFIDARWSDVTTIALCMVLFAIGTFGFLASFPTAFERSRRDEIGAANLYVLTGESTPKDVKRKMLAALLVQVAVAITAASIGISRQDNAHRLNPMAFAVLVPMLGFGLNGAWAARYGKFGPRIPEPQRGRRRATGNSESPDNDVEMEQNSSHG